MENNSSMWGEPSNEAITCLSRPVSWATRMSARLPPAFSAACCRRDFRGEGALIQPLDDGPEQRFLGFEMVVERLSRQARGIGRLLNRRPPKAMAAEHEHRGIENAVRAFI